MILETKIAKEIVKGRREYDDEAWGRRYSEGTCTKMYKEAGARADLHVHHHTCTWWLFFGAIVVVVPA